MDFLEARETNKRFSILFGGIFILVAVVWSLSIYWILKIIIWFFAILSNLPKKPGEVKISNYETPALIMSIIFLALIVYASVRRIKQIHEGGSTFIATSLGGDPLDPSAEGTSSPLARRKKALMNIVSELAVAASISEPDVYLLPAEEGINAMACGLTPEDSAVIVSRGVLTRLDRDEISAVIGHELSHVINGDTPRFTIMAGWLHGLFLVQMTGKEFLKRAPMVKPVIIGLAMVVFGYLANLFGKLIMAAFCRRREMLADAMAVQFTRTSLPLAGALKKIGGLRYGSLLKSPAAIGLSHFFLAKPVRTNWFSLHPPLEKRIKALDPAWDGNFHDFQKYPVDFLSNRPRSSF